jgi:hypothetical protein
VPLKFAGLRKICFVITIKPYLRAGDRKNAN